jgi:eukaryotic-like serine/threonine-protein kinase
MALPRFDIGFSPSREEKRRESRAFSGILWLGIFSLTFLSLLLLGLQSWAFMSGTKVDVVVPDVKGISYEAAALSVEQADLVLRIRTEAYSDKIEVNQIMDQSPAGGARVKVGREIMVDVSLGSRTLKTPNVIGQPKDKAITDLEKLGVTYRLTTQYSDAAPDETVINQRPVGGAPIALGEPVDLVIAARPLNTMTSVPHLEGLPYDEALALIKDSKLVLHEVRRVYQTDVDKVTVFTQFPLSGSQVMAGTDVILTLTCPASEETEGQRSAKVSVTVPESSGTVQVRIVVQDRYQTREAYSSEQTGPTTVEQLITSYGRTTVKVYFNNEIIREETY